MNKTDKSVFISYASKDKERVDVIREFIEENDIRCWIAPRDVVGGMPYAKEIVGAIRSCRIVLLIVSFSINSSEQILNEIEMAIDNSKIILPFKIDPVEYNDDYKYYLKRKHWIDASSDCREYYGELLTSIKYLLTKEETDTDTIDDRYLIALKEKNRRELIKRTEDKRLSFGLSIENDSYQDLCHFYDRIKRVDLIDTPIGKYSSYRWIEITNKSDTPTSYIIHKECGENKVKFTDMRVKAKRVTGENDVNLQVESITEIQPSFIQLIKIHFDKVLLPGETVKIFYRLDWPGEALVYYDGELSTGISFTRYPLGVGGLIFGIMDSVPIYGFELHEIKNTFEQNVSKIARKEMKITDDDDLKPLHDKPFAGAYYEIDDVSGNTSYRILYKQNIRRNTDEEDLF